MRFVALLLITGLLVGAPWKAWSQEAKSAAEKVSYDEHIRPILREHCFACHSADKQESGLQLDTYQKVMAGGSSGEVVIAGDLDSSRLWALVSHKEEPKMPPKQDKLAAAKLELIKKWIELGAPENAGSKVTLRKNPLAAVAPANVGKPTGPVAMPVGLLRQPVAYTKRAGQITALAANPWAPVVAVAGQKQVALYNSDDGQLFGILPFPEGIPYVLRFSRSGSVLLVGGGRGGQSGCVVLFDVATGKRMAKIGDELDAVLAADINSTHTLVALGGPSRVVRIYSVQSGELQHEIRKHTDWIYSVEFSPDGKLLATSDRSAGLFVWEADTAREYLNLRGHTGAIFDVSWRDDSTILASAGEDTTIKLWELKEGNAVKSWNAHAGGAFCVRYAHDGRLISAGRDSTVKTWNGDGAAGKSLPAFSEPALRCAFTHDGHRVAGGDWLGNVKIWDLDSAKEVFALPANPPTLQMRIDLVQATLSKQKTATAKAADELVAAQKRLDEKEAALKASDAKEGEESQLARLTKDKSESEADLSAKKSAADEANAALKKAEEALSALLAEKKSFDERADRLETAAAEAQAAAEAAATELKAFVEAYGKK
jgi:WD40 repeat protein